MTSTKPTRISIKQPNEWNYQLIINKFTQIVRIVKEEKTKQKQTRHLVTVVVCCLSIPPLFTNIQLLSVSVTNLKIKSTKFHFIYNIIYVFSLKVYLIKFIIYELMFTWLSHFYKSNVQTLWHKSIPLHQNYFRPRI